MPDTADPAHWRPTPPSGCPAPSSPARYRLTLDPDLDAATFTGTAEIDLIVHEPVTDDRLQRRRAGHRRRGASRDPTAATVGGHRRAGRRRPSGSPSPSPSRSGPPGGDAALLVHGVLNDKLRGFYRSTFTDESGGRPAPSPPPRWRPPTPGGPSRAGTSRTARPSSRSPWWSTMAWPPTPTRRWSTRPPEGTRRAGCASPPPWRCRPTWWPSSWGRWRRPSPSTSTASRSGSSTRRARATWPPYALEVARPRAALLHRVLRHPLPGRQARPRGHPRLRLRGHGEPRLRDLPGDGAAGRPGHGGPHRARAGGRRGGGPRARPHVVRRPGDHALVGGDLAQRGLRHLHGDAVRRRLPARVGDAGSASASRARRPWPSTACTPPGPIEYPVGSPAEADGMFDVLTYEKGASVLRMLEQYLGPRGLPRRGADLPRPPRLRQHRDRRPVGRPRGGERPAGARRHGHAGSSRAATRWCVVGDDGRHPAALLLPAGRRRGRQRHR